jgi:hypothetical protein
MRRLPNGYGPLGTRPGNAHELFSEISIGALLFDQGCVLCDFVAASRDALEVIQIEVGETRRWTPRMKWLRK